MNSFIMNLYVMGIDARDRLSREDRGATAVEYGLMVGLIAVAIIAAVLLLGENLTGLFGEVNESIPAAG